MAIPDPLTIAHSPDADDAFMFYALSTGKVPTPGGRVEHVLSDIETLNQAAMQGKYHVTAISAHQYPYLRDRYRLCVVGASTMSRHGRMVIAVFVSLYCHGSCIVQVRCRLQSSMCRVSSRL